MTAEGNGIFIGQALTTKNIERTADGDIESVVSSFLQQLQILQISDAAGIGGRQRCPLAKFFHQLLLYPGTFAFDIRGMDKKFIAIIGQLARGFARR